ncbi:MAG: hypothetical protein AB7F25_06985 [Deferribacterales bacterium]
MQIKLSAPELRKIFGLTNREISAALGKPLSTIEQHMAARESARHRNMPDSDKMLLILRYKIIEMGYNPDKLIDDFLSEHNKSDGA